MNKKLILRLTIPYNWQHKFEELVDNQVDKLVDKLSKTEKNVFDTIPTFITTRIGNKM